MSLLDGRGRDVRGPPLHNLAAESLRVCACIVFEWFPVSDDDDGGGRQTDRLWRKRHELNQSIRESAALFGRQVREESSGCDDVGAASRAAWPPTIHGIPPNSSSALSLLSSTSWSSVVVGSPPLPQRTPACLPDATSHTKRAKETPVLAVMERWRDKHMLRRPNIALAADRPGEKQGRTGAAEGAAK